MQYLTHIDYRQYGGLLDSSAFDRFEYRAEKIIDSYTQSRLKDVTYDDLKEEVKRCMYELVEYLSSNCNNGSVSGKQSESNDGYSVSYENKNADQAIRGIVYTYLSDTGLMYRGVTL